MTNQFNPDHTHSELPDHDPLHSQATAYVFGELTTDDALAFERTMQQSSEITELVDSIRQTVSALENEFALESSPIREADRQRVEEAIAGKHPSEPVDGSIVDVNRRSRRIGWVAGFVIAASTLLAAVLVWPGGGATSNGIRVSESLRSERDATLDRQSYEVAEADGVLQREGFDRVEQEELAQTEFLPKVSVLNATPPQFAAPASMPGESGEQASLSKRMATKNASELSALTRRINPSGSKEVVIRSEAPANQDPSLGVISDLEEKLVPELGQIVVRGSQRDVKKLKAAVESMEKAAESAQGPAFQGPVLEGPVLEGPVLEGSHAPFSGGAIGGGGMSGSSGGMRGAASNAGEAATANPRRMRRSRANATKAATGKSEMDDMMMDLEMGMDLEMDMDMDMDMDMGMGMGVTSSDQIAAGNGRFSQGDFGNRPVPLVRVEAIAAQPEPFGEAFGRDRFAAINDNAFEKALTKPLSTFSIDVDTAAYSKVRMYLMQHNQLPAPDAVRIEELLNYFRYDYALPTGEHPFAAAMEIANCPWNPKHRLARIGIKGKTIDAQRPASNLVFLLDVSGSMNQSNKLPLVIQGMKMLVSRLTENDSVAIVVYAGAAGLVLDSTTGDQTKTILDSLERLKAGGSTAGAQGIQRAYEVARDNYIPGGTNRVILCTDGDFNVGVTGTDALVKLAAENAKGNVFLTMLGFGSGNHNDAMMEEVSNKANGNYAFIDTETEAAKVLVQQMQSTLVTIAKDVKIQIEFNPAEVESYRLIGYENRVMAAKDFADDKKDAGEIGAGHTVTALYEIVPAKEIVAMAKQKDESPDAIDLRYQKPAAESKPQLLDQAGSGELLTLKLRYKQPTSTKSTLIEFPVKDSGKRFDQVDQDFQFASSVAAFGMLLRNSPHKGDANFDSVEELAIAGAKGDKSGYRKEFVELVRRAKELSK